MKGAIGYCRLKYCSTRHHHFDQRPQVRLPGLVIHSFSAKSCFLKWCEWAINTLRLCGRYCCRRWVPELRLYIDARRRDLGVWEFGKRSLQTWLTPTRPSPQLVMSLNQTLIEQFIEWWTERNPGETLMCEGSQYGVITSIYLFFKIDQERVL